MTALAGGFEGAWHILPVRIYYEDTDLTGVVYHAGHVRFFERGRSEYLRAAGVDLRALMALAEPCAFAVTKLAVAYRAPARLGDTLLVRTLFEKMRGVRFVARQQLTRDETLVAEAEVEVICVDPEGRPRKPPRQLLDRLRPRLGSAMS